MVFERSSARWDYDKLTRNARTPNGVDGIAHEKPALRWRAVGNEPTITLDHFGG